MANSGYLTPIDRFFVRNHAPTPRVDLATWRLRVEGPGVERTLELGYEDLGRLPSVSVVRALECAGNGRVFFAEQQGREAPGTPWRLGAIGVAEWAGVRLREILDRAGLKEKARGVMVEGLDAVRMRRPLPLWKALEEDTILATGMNGQPLPPDHGFPARTIVPGWAAVASVKWVGRLVVSEGPLNSPWNTAKYVMTGGQMGFPARTHWRAGAEKRHRVAVAGHAAAREADHHRALVVGWRRDSEGRVCFGRRPAVAPDSSSWGRTFPERGRVGASPGTRGREHTS